MICWNEYFSKLNFNQNCLKCSYSKSAKIVISDLKKKNKKTHPFIPKIYFYQSKLTKLSNKWLTQMSRIWPLDLDLRIGLSFQTGLHIIFWLGFGTDFKLTQLKFEITIYIYSGISILWYGYSASKPSWNSNIMKNWNTFILYFFLIRP